MISQTLSRGQPPCGAPVAVARPKSKKRGSSRLAAGGDSLFPPAISIASKGGARGVFPLSARRCDPLSEGGWLRRRPSFAWGRPTQDRLFTALYF